MVKAGKDDKGIWGKKDKDEDQGVAVRVMVTLLSEVDGSFSFSSRGGSRSRRVLGGGYGSVGFLVDLDSAGSANAPVLPCVHSFILSPFPRLLLSLLLPLRFSLPLHIGCILVLLPISWFTFQAAR